MTQECTVEWSGSQKKFSTHGEGGEKNLYLTKKEAKLGLSLKQGINIEKWFAK